MRSVERAPGSEIDLGSSEVVLFTAGNDDDAIPTPTYLFSIPLPQDAPQCLHTPQSALEYTLTATLESADPGAPDVSNTAVVHTRRYTSHPDILGSIPETQAIDAPTRIEVQVPRTTFHSGEAIPLYLTIPPPRRELILDEGIRLRNIRAELVRTIRLNQKEASTSGNQEDNTAGPSLPRDKSGDVSTSQNLDMRQFVGTPGGGEIIALSGSSCRLHPTRSLQLRLVLHPNYERTPDMSANTSGELPSGSVDVNCGHEASCASISQVTVLHEVSFTVLVHATFMHMRTHTERISTIAIPVVLLAPTAPLPEVEESVDTAYRKKHDRPPMRTVRDEDGDVPKYEEGEPGPSYSAAPPPFEEREAPPPFFSEPEASGSRLPTFLESETEIYMPSADDLEPPPPSGELTFDGEGSLFGFPPSEQFDGYQEHERSTTPPPSMEMARRDPDVTSLATLDETTLNALELALEQHQDVAAERVPPPPPPPMDDPSDPPPSIHSAFRSPAIHHASTASHLPPQPTSPRRVSISAEVSHEHAPPPYRGVPDDHQSDHDDEQVAHPPPYVDLVPVNVPTLD